MTTISRITTHLLSTSPYIGIINLIILILSAQIGGNIFSLQILLIGILIYLHIRIYFDQRLFSDLINQQLTLESLDDALYKLNLQKKPINRPLVDRSLGAIKIWKYIIYATLVQLLCLFIQS